MVRPKIRARYSPKMPRVKSCTPENNVTMVAKKYEARHRRSVKQIDAEHADEDSKAEQRECKSDDAHEPQRRGAETRQQIEGMVDQFSDGVIRDAGAAPLVPHFDRAESSGSPRQQYVDGYERVLEILECFAQLVRKARNALTLRAFSAPMALCNANFVNRDAKFRSNPCCSTCATP